MVPSWEWGEGKGSAGSIPIDVGKRGVGVTKGTQNSKKKIGISGKNRGFGGNAFLALGAALSEGWSWHGPSLLISRLRAFIGISDVIVHSFTLRCASKQVQSVMKSLLRFV